VDPSADVQLTAREKFHMTDDSLVRRLYEVMGVRVRSRRAALRMRQEDLAAAARISRSSVANIERGQQQPPVHVLLALADALGLEMSALLPTRAELEAHLSAPHKVPKLVSIGGVSSLMTEQLGRLVGQILSAAGDAPTVLPESPPTSPERAATRRSLGNRRPAPSRRTGGR
jgi:transcriptional regulator with XRE-family HTH domain